jgi:hypothetical protein
MPEISGKPRSSSSRRHAQRRAIHTLPQIHQRKKRAEHARLQFVGHVHSAGGNARQQFALIADEVNYFGAAFRRGIPGNSFPPQLRALLLQLQREMQKAVFLGFYLRGHGHLTTGHSAGLNQLRGTTPEERFFHWSQPKSSPRSFNFPIRKLS